MAHELTTLIQSLIAILLGTSIAVWHLSLLRIGLSTFGTRRNPGRFIVITGLVRMLSVGFLLLIIARQLDVIPLVLFITSFIVARISLLPKFAPGPSKRH